MVWRITDVANGRFRRNRFPGSRDGNTVGSGFGGSSFSTNVTGLSTDSIGLYGQVGTHASIGFTVAPSGAVDETKWSASSNPAAAATFGTGTAPTDFTAADGFQVFLHVRRGAEWVTRSFNVRRAPGAFAALVNQSFTDDTGPQTYQHAAGTGTGITWSYAQVGSLPNISYVGGTRTFTFETNPLAVQSGTVLTVRATDQYGRFIDRTFTLAITANLAVNPVILSGVFADPANGLADTLTTGGTYAGADIIDGTLQFRQGTTLRATFTQLGLTVTGGNFSFDTLIQNSNLVYEAGSSAADMPNVDNIRVTVSERTNGGTATFDVTGVSGIDMAAATFNGAGSTPADNATGVALTGNLVAAWSENVFAGTGLFTLRNVTAGTDVETFNVATGLGSAGGTITIPGTTSVTISPGAARLGSTAYAGRWAAGALVDQDGNPIAANTGDTLWNWTTVAPANFTDNFNRADGALGANWTNFTTYGGPGLGYQIVSNRARTVDPGFNGIRTTTSITGAAFAQATFQGATGGIEVQYGVILADPTTTTRCYLFIQNRAGGSIELYRVTANGSSFALLATGTAGNLNAGDVMRIERTIVNASTVRVRALVNGTQVATFDDTDANRISGDVFGGMWGEINTAGRLADMDDFSQGAA